jgi:hypothetical protein
MHTAPVATGTPAASLLVRGSDGLYSEPTSDEAAAAIRGTGSRLTP